MEHLCNSQGIPGLCGIDTRALTKHIRSHGSMRARLTLDADSGADPPPLVDTNADNLVSHAPRKAIAIPLQRNTLSSAAIKYETTKRDGKTPHIVASTVASKAIKFAVCYDAAPTLASRHTTATLRPRVCRKTLIEAFKRLSFRPRRRLPIERFRRSDHVREHCEANQEAA